MVLTTLAIEKESAKPVAVSPRPSGSDVVLNPQDPIADKPMGVEVLDLTADDSSEEAPQSCASASTIFPKSSTSMTSSGEERETTAPMP